MDRPSTSCNTRSDTIETSPTATACPKRPEHCLGWMPMTAQALSVDFVMASSSPRWLPGAQQFRPHACGEEFHRRGPVRRLRRTNVTRFPIPHAWNSAAVGEAIDCRSSCPSRLEERVLKQIRRTRESTEVARATASSTTSPCHVALASSDHAFLPCVPGRSSALFVSSSMSRAPGADDHRHRSYDQ